jgi:hypothetical protein
MLVENADDITLQRMDYFGFTQVGKSVTEAVQSVLEAAKREYTITLCQLCYLHTVLDYEPDYKFHKFYKLHTALRAYFWFLQEEGRLNR